jgi:hypothetical protein
MTASKPQWVFTSRLRANAYGWKGSKPAIQRLKEAVSEIKKAARKDPALGAEGAILVMERIWPAFQQIDSSSGALGNAVYKTLNDLAPLLVNARVARSTREKWLDRLWQAIIDDGVDYLAPLEQRWGEVCGTPEVASEWADRLVPLVRKSWIEDEGKSYYKGTCAGLSCLLATGRYDELLALLEHAPFVSWGYRQYGVKALLFMGKTTEALGYAEASRGPYETGSFVDKACEEILLSSGSWEEAYKRYAFAANRKTNHLSTFCAICKKYSMKDEREILTDLIRRSPGEEGKWFAAAKELGDFELALDLGFKGPCEPQTLNRAAEEFHETDPRFAAGIAVASIKNLCAGRGYEPAPSDAIKAFSLAKQAAQKVGAEEEVLTDIRALIQHDYSLGEFASKAIRRELEREPAGKGL